jgi:ribosomal protein L3
MMKFDEISGAQTVHVTTEKFDKVATSINETLENNDGSPVENTQIANLAIAVGFKEERREEPESTNKPIKMESLDQDKVLRTMVERRHGDASAEELKDIMEQYLEGGIREIAEDIEAQNYFEYHRYLDTDINTSSKGDS